MTWMLELFPEFRALRLRYAALAAVAKEAQARALEAEHDAALQADTIVALKQALHGAEGVADFFCQRVTGRKMYAELPTLPEGAPGPVPVYKAKRQARDLVNEGNFDFAREQAEMLKRAQQAG
jgi:hypothetical protein